MSKDSFLTSVSIERSRILKDSEWVVLHPQHCISSTLVNLGAWYPSLRLAFVNPKTIAVSPCGFPEGDPVLNGVDALDGASVIRSMVSRSEGNSWASISGKPERRFCAFDCGDHSSMVDVREESEFEVSGGAWTPAKPLDWFRFASSFGRFLVLI